MAPRIANRAIIVLAVLYAIAMVVWPRFLRRPNETISWDETAETRWSISTESNIPFFTSQAMDRRVCWTTGRWSDPGQPIVVAMAERSDPPRLSNFLLQLRRFNYKNIELMVFNQSDSRAGSEQLPVRFARYRILAAKLSPSRLVTFVDPDVLFFQSPDRLVDRFAKFNPKRVIFGASMLCDNVACRNEALAKWNGRLMEGSKFLDSGAMIGRASNFIWLFEEAQKLAKDGLDEQAIFGKLSADHSDRIAVDWDAALFGVLPPSREFFSDSWDLESLGSASESRDRTNMSGIPRRIGSNDWPVAVRQSGLQPAGAQTINQCQVFSTRIYNSMIQAAARIESSIPKPRIVVSLTSIPPRYPHLIETLKSLLEQTLPPDAIYLNIATEYARTFGQSTELPPDLLELPNITINRCEDFGPATKLIPTLDKETDPDTLIMTADDDLAYHPETIASLVDVYRRWPNAAYGHSGQMIDMVYGLGPTVVSAHNHADETVPVDILEAFRGGLYKRAWFDASIKRIREPRFSPCFRTDDIWISAHLAAKGIPRIKLGTRPGAWPRFTANDNTEPLRHENVGKIRRNDRCARYLLDTFKKSWTTEPERCPIDYLSLALKGQERDEANNPRYRETLTSPCSSPAYVALEANSRGLQVAEIMRSGQSLKSPSGKYGLRLEARSMLCAAKVGGGPQTCFPANAPSGIPSSESHLLFEPSGRICVYPGSTPYSKHPSKSVFCSHPIIPAAQLQGAELRMEDNGNFGIFGRNGTRFWGGRAR